MNSRPWWAERAEAAVQQAGQQIVIVPDAQSRVPVVVFHPLRCPFCGSTNVVVTKTVKDECSRHHACRNCKKNFRSVRPDELPPRF